MSDLSYPLSQHDLAELVRRSLPRHRGGTADEDTCARLREGQGCCVAIGAFDGMHGGHRQLVEVCRVDARRRGLPAVVVTFDPDPAELVGGPQHQRRLLQVEDRIDFCYDLGANAVLVVPFTSDVASLTPEEFASYLEERLGRLASVHVGSNFRFGRRASGSVATLRAIGLQRGFDVVEQQLLEFEDAPVSSTRIRELLAHGQVGDARVLLGRSHYVRGVVAHGRGEGTAFGFPTANVCCDALDCLPCEGVYACAVTDGVHAWPAAANVGKPPTFTDEHDQSFLEANLMGFSGDLYGIDLSVVFIEWLRASRPFDSLEELERVVLGNIAWVRDNVGAEGVEVAP